MSLRDVLAIYGPNKAGWSPEDYSAIQRSKVSWVIWRLDADLAAPTILARLGVKVIAQARDRFNGDPYTVPSRNAENDHDTLMQTCPPGTPFVPDNEPNLDPKRAGQWYAEQWTRYLRAYFAEFRWLDPGGQFPLLTPPLAVGPDRNSALWHRVGVQNLSAAYGWGFHAYWQESSQLVEGDFGLPWRLLPWPNDPTPLYVLEYANTAHDRTQEQSLAQYELWLRALPDKVRCAALFILDPTPDWSRFAITEPVIEWLAGLE